MPTTRKEEKILNCGLEFWTLLSSPSTNNLAEMAPSDESKENLLDGNGIMEVKSEAFQKPQTEGMPTKMPNGVEER